MPADRHFSPAIRGLLTIRPAPLRWPFAAAVAACTAALVATGWAAGDIGAGLIATLGVFTADYGSRRPYVNRAFHLAVIAVALAAAVTIGVWSAQSGWLAVTSVSAVAVGAVWLCSGLAVGPPGAFIFALACAAGVGVSASHRPAWHRIATFQRGAGRVIGTLAGLCLAALILGAGPTGLWLALVLASLQFAIKMSNVRNYALATVFTTATGLTIASAAHRVDVGRAFSSTAHWIP